MKAGPLVVITPRLPPQVCGIGAYSWLAHQHRPEGCEPGQFLVMEGGRQSRSFLNWNGIQDFTGGRSLALALDRIGRANVLLHYAGRAYQRLGCPIWMPGALATWKTKFPESRLTIFFHELPGKLPFLSRHFALGKIDAGIIRRLSAVADVLVTNTETHAAILRKLSGGRDVHFLPVATNIAPVETSPEPRRNTEFVIFGLPFGRLQTLEMFATEIQSWQTNGYLTALHLIGPEDKKFTTRADKLIERSPWSGVVVRHGALPENEIASLFARTGYALTNVTQETWSKSGAFMACAATGCCAIIKGEKFETGPLSYAISAGELEKISEAERTNRTMSLKAWYYQNADWEVTAKRLSYLSENGGSIW